MKKTITSLLFVGAFLAAGGAVAQFSMPSIPGMGKSSGGGSADLGGQQDSLVKGYVSANKDVLNANAIMAEALGLKDQAVASRATADALKEGATKDNLDAANKAVATSTDAVAAEIAKGPKLDAAAKATFGVGLASLSSGVIKYVALGKDVKDMGSNLKSASPAALPKLQSAVFVVSKFPDSLSSVSKGLKNAIDFAKANDIPIPKDATSAL